MSIFSDRLRLLRKEKHISQAQLAQVINKSRVSVTAYENDSRLPDVDTLALIADFFDEDVDWIMGRTDLRTVRLQSSELPITPEMFKLLSDVGLATIEKSSRGELRVDMSNEAVSDLFNNAKVQQGIADTALDKVLDLFGLPVAAKSDLARAILSVAMKHGVIETRPL